MTLLLGTKAPLFQLPDAQGREHSLKHYRGSWVILYFYPKDDTPGCTIEACSFRDHFPELKRAGIVVLGVSIDPVKKHQKFIEKYTLPFTLLSDEEKKVVALYGVWGEKPARIATRNVAGGKFMGREYLGTKRVSFLIDPEGKIRKIYDPVKPLGHAELVVSDVNALKE